MKRYRLIDDGKPYLVFDGEELGSASSKRPGKDRWTEVTIYRTNVGRLIAHVVGGTDIAGEETFGKCHIGERFEDIEESLTLGDGSLSTVARNALEEAGYTPVRVVK